VTGIETLEPARWEHGSDFPLLVGIDSGTTTPPWGTTAVLTGSGRAALQQLLEYGRSARGWKRLWVPSYYCPDVLPSIVRAGLELRPYRRMPLDTEILLPSVARPSTDAILSLNYFGLRSVAPPGAAIRPEGVDLIEDHTHDPFSGWAITSEADFCIASLRKTLPVPDGGVLWSPRQHNLPLTPGLTLSHSSAVAHKLAGMALKELYLAGEVSDKQLYRELYYQGEQQLELGGPSGMSSWSRGLLPSLPIHEWRQQRQVNHDRLHSMLEHLCELKVLAPNAPGDAAPAVCTLICESAAGRDALKTHLVAQNVFPAILWSLEAQSVLPASSADLELSQKILAVQCDMRYTVHDMERVGNTILEWSRDSQ
jgi:hypothetical protein